MPIYFSMTRQFEGGRPLSQTEWQSAHAPTTLHSSDAQFWPIRSDGEEPRGSCLRGVWDCMMCRRGLAEKNAAMAHAFTRQTGSQHMPIGRRRGIDHL